MSKIYRFPVNQDNTGRLIATIVFTSLGIILLFLHTFITQKFPVYFGWLPLIVGVLIYGVKRNVTIDTVSGTVKSVKGFYFLTSTEMFLKREFEEIYIRRSVTSANPEDIRSRDTTSYSIILNGRGMITVDSFPNREGALHWMHELAEALQLKFGAERSEDGTIDKNIPIPPRNLDHEVTRGIF